MEAFRSYCSEKYASARAAGLHSSAHDAVDWIPLLMGEDRMREVLRSEEFKRYYDGCNVYR